MAVSFVLLMEETGVPGEYHKLIVRCLCKQTNEDIRLVGGDLKYQA
jgi:hypothetical protein